MDEYKKTLKEDLNRYNGKPQRYIKRYLYLFRKTHYSKNKIIRNYYRLLYRIHSNKRGIEISSGVNIGGGLYLGHFYNVTINENVVIGKNVNIHKGVTIGQENRGPRKGVPIIGDNVWIGINTTIVGNIKIGNDVLIAPGAYVNFDVPNHSIVIGNPGKIIHKDNATKGYINSY